MWKKEGAESAEPQSLHGQSGYPGSWISLLLEATCQGCAGQARVWCHCSGGNEGLGEEGLKIQSEEQQDLPLWDLILFVPVYGIISPRVFGSLWSPVVCPLASPALDLGVGE